MRIITVFVSDDGVRFDTETACRAHESAVAYMKDAMRELEGVRSPYDLENDENSYVEHPVHVVREAWRATVRLFAIKNSKVEEWRDKTWTYGAGWVGRFVETQGDLNRALHRFMCIAPDGREYQQPYYAIQRAKELEGENRNAFS